MPKINTPKRPVKKAHKRAAPSRRSLLVHHRHTGRLVAKRHTSYPLLTLILVLAGFFMVFTTTQLHAETVQVTAKVKNPIAPQDASVVITSPVSGTHVSESPIEVRGTCTPYYFIKLFRNTIFAGSALCDGSGEFVITTDVFYGENEFIAHLANGDDEEGPPSAPVKVYYDAPVTPGSGPAGSGGGSVSPGVPGGSGKPSQSGQFYITSEYYFQAAFSGQEISRKLTIVGGSAPYVLRVHWGDGKTDTYPNVTTQTFTIRHTYYTADPTERANFTVKIEAMDQRNATAMLQLFSIINDAAITGAAQGITHGYDDQARFGNWSSSINLLAWPAFAIVVLVAFSFWLGERRGEAIEYNKLHKPRPQRRKSHA